MVLKNKEKLTEKLEVKNKFVTSLRDYLQKKYEINYVYTYGEKDSVTKVENGSYGLVKRTKNEPMDIPGFCFSKDLVKDRWFLNREDIHKAIHNFSKTQENIKSLLNISKKGNDALERLRQKRRKEINLDRYVEIDHDIQLDKNKYSVSVYIGEGYAGNIDIQLQDKI